MLLMRGLWREPNAGNPPVRFDEGRSAHAGLRHAESTEARNGDGAVPQQAAEEAAEGAEAGRMEMGAERGSVGAWERERVGAWEGHLPAGINRIGESSPRSTLTSQKLCDCFCPRPDL